MYLTEIVPAIEMEDTVPYAFLHYTRDRLTLGIGRLIKPAPSRKIDAISCSNPCSHVIT